MHRGVCSAGEAVKALCEAIFVLPALKDEKKKAKRETGVEIWG